MKNNLINLKEVDYSEMFKPETMRKLKSSSAESLRTMLRGQDVMSAMQEGGSLLRKIRRIEEDYREELSNLAVNLAQEVFPIIEDQNIEIQARLVDNINQPIPDPDEQPVDELNLDTIEMFPEEVKRRIINSISQGSGIRNSFMFYMFRESLDMVDPSLISSYQSLLEKAYGVFDDDDAVAMFMAMLSQGGGVGAGVEDVFYNEEEEHFVIKAEATIFPILLQEIVKGLYEILSLQGFSRSKEDNQKIVKSVDKLTNEPEDIRFGKFIYDAINDLYIQGDYEDSRVREYLFVEIYKMDVGDFVPFIENLINGKLTSDQKRWVDITLQDIADDLKKDDTGLEDLD